MVASSSEFRPGSVAFLARAAAFYVFNFNFFSPCRFNKSGPEQQRQHQQRKMTCTKEREPAKEARLGNVKMSKTTKIDSLLASSSSGHRNVQATTPPQFPYSHFHFHPAQKQQQWQQCCLCVTILIYSCCLSSEAFGRERVSGGLKITFNYVSHVFLSRSLAGCCLPLAARRREMEKRAEIIRHNYECLTMRDAEAHEYT
jgi:hypothetical protein